MSFEIWVCRERAWTGNNEWSLWSRFDRSQDDAVTQCLSLMEEYPTSTWAVYEPESATYYMGREVLQRLLGAGAAMARHAVICPLISRKNAIVRHDGLSTFTVVAYTVAEAYEKAMTIRRGHVNRHGWMLDGHHLHECGIGINATTRFYLSSQKDGVRRNYYLFRSYKIADLNLYQSAKLIAAQIIPPDPEGYTDWRIHQDGDDDDTLGEVTEGRYHILAKIEELDGSPWVFPETAASAEEAFEKVKELKCRWPHARDWNIINEDFVITAVDGKTASLIASPAAKQESQLNNASTEPLPLAEALKARREGSSKVFEPFDLLDDHCQPITRLYPQVIDGLDLHTSAMLAARQLMQPGQVLWIQKVGQPPYRYQVPQDLGRFYVYRAYKHSMALVGSSDSRDGALDVAGRHSVDGEWRIVDRDTMQVEKIITPFMTVLTRGDEQHIVNCVDSASGAEEKAEIFESSKVDEEEQGKTMTDLLATAKNDTVTAAHVAASRQLVKLVITGLRKGPNFPFKKDILVFLKTKLGRAVLSALLGELQILIPQLSGPRYARIGKALRVEGIAAVMVLASTGIGAALIEAFQIAGSLLPSEENPAPPPES